MNIERNRELVNSFVESMKESIRFYAKGRLSELEIMYLAEYQVNRLDFENEWQMHKGIGYFARKVVNNYERIIMDDRAIPTKPLKLIKPDPNYKVDEKELAESIKRNKEIIESIRKIRKEKNL